MDFTGAIIRWYDEHKRKLPWREINDPYRIWISEIILQQTRVDQGLGYYLRFIDRFPDIRTLAEAPQEEVMKIWQGLGYYSRARNMHETAVEICRDHHSTFPSTYQELIRLKGIGDYSASAIASIAFNGPHPVVDGNVLRVIARFAGISDPVNLSSTKKKIKDILLQLIDSDRPGEFNQAVMELGALVCTPRQPACDRCPLQPDCHAFRLSLTAQLPVIEKARPRSILYFHYLVFLSQENGEWSTWMKKRTGNGIWKNLYDFPMIEASRELLTEELMSSEEFLIFTRNARLADEPVMVEKTRHILTHRDLRVSFTIFRVEHYSFPGHLRMPLVQTRNYPVPRLIEIFLKKLHSDRVYFSTIPINR